MVTGGSVEGGAVTGRRMSGREAGESDWTGRSGLTGPVG